MANIKKAIEDKRIIIAACSEVLKAIREKAKAEKRLESADAALVEIKRNLDALRSRPSPTSLHLTKGDRKV